MCAYHEEIAGQQILISAHLVWLRKLGWAMISLILLCLGSLGSIAYSLTGVGHSLALQAQANRDAIYRINTDIGELKQVDREMRDAEKDMCKRIDRIEWKSGLKGGAKGEDRRLFSDPE
jgi:hypothetical protein